MKVKVGQLVVRTKWGKCTGCGDRMTTRFPPGSMARITKLDMYEGSKFGLQAILDNGYSVHVDDGVLVPVTPEEAACYVLAQ